jgi:hypothetical protein
MPPKRKGGRFSKKSAVGKKAKGKTVVNEPEESDDEVADDVSNVPDAGSPSVEAVNQVETADSVMGVLAAAEVPEVSEAPEASVQSKKRGRSVKKGQKSSPDNRKKATAAEESNNDDPTTVNASTSDDKEQAGNAELKLDSNAGGVALAPVSEEITRASSLSSLLPPAFPARSESAVAPLAPNSYADRRSSQDAGRLSSNRGSYDPYSRQVGRQNSYEGTHKQSEELSWIEELRSSVTNCEV